MPTVSQDQRETDTTTKHQSEEALMSKPLHLHDKPQKINAWSCLTVRSTFRVDHLFGFSPSSPNNKNSQRRPRPMKRLHKAMRGPRDTNEQMETRAARAEVENKVQGQSRPQEDRILLLLHLLRQAQVRRAHRQTTNLMTAVTKTLRHPRRTCLLCRTSLTRVRLIPLSRPHREHSRRGFKRPNKLTKSQCGNARLLANALTRKRRNVERKSSFDA